MLLTEGAVVSELPLPVLVGTVLLSLPLVVVGPIVGVVLLTVSPVVVGGTTVLWLLLSVLVTVGVGDEPVSVGGVLETPVPLFEALKLMPLSVAVGDAVGVAERDGGSTTLVSMDVGTTRSDVAGTDTDGAVTDGTVSDGIVRPPVGLVVAAVVGPVTPAVSDACVVGVSEMLRPGLVASVVAAVVVGFAAVSVLSVSVMERSELKLSPIDRPPEVDGPVAEPDGPLESAAEVVESEGGVTTAALLACVPVWVAACVPVESDD